MQRYGVIVTEKVGRDDGVLHWLKRGTLVQFIPDERVQCIIPCYPVDMAVEQMGCKAHAQYVNPEDVIEIPPDQLAALRVSSEA